MKATWAQIQKAADEGKLIVKHWNYEGGKTRLQVITRNNHIKGGVKPRTLTLVDEA